MTFYCSRHCPVGKSTYLWAESSCTRTSYNTITDSNTSVDPSLRPDTATQLYHKTKKLSSRRLRCPPYSKSSTSNPSWTSCSLHHNFGRCTIRPVFGVNMVSVCLLSSLPTLRCQSGKVWDYQFCRSYSRSKQAWICSCCCRGTD